MTAPKKASAVAIEGYALLQLIHQSSSPYIWGIGICEAVIVAKRKESGRTILWSGSECQ
jgi:hypothetical protein